MLKPFPLQDEADGSNEYNNFQRGSLNTTRELIRDLKNIDIVFHIGDICYANGYISQWDQFTAQVEPIASTVPYMIARFHHNVLTHNIWAYSCLVICLMCQLVINPYSGNHERDWPGTGSFYGNMDSGGECGVLAETMFYVPAENRAKFWYRNIATFQIWVAFHSPISVCIYMESRLQSDCHSPKSLCIYMFYE